MASDDDTPLMLAAGQGDREAFSILVERHHPAVVQYAYRFLGTSDRDTAEDLAQEVFLAAWKAAPSFRPRAKVLTWLFRIATNACLNYRRGYRLRAAVQLDDAAASGYSGPETDRPDIRAIAREQAEKVRQAIACLSANQRAAILLRHFQGLSYVEIADVLETSVAAVESLLFRARETLGAVLSADEADAAPQVLPQAGVK
jgi:RNA polymerase sigma-70 factor (ECF subfamily)